MNTTHAIKLGIAGNMTGHLEQAGEAGDFTEVTAAAGRPKGLFPWHVPGAPGLLGVDPVSDSRLVIAVGEERVQQEPEVALFCALYWADGVVSAVRPLAFAAYNDASLRMDAPKIRWKKHWGPASKGLGPWLPVDGLAPGGTLDRYRLAGFVVRDGSVLATGEDSAVIGYETFHEPLLDWIVERLNHQQDEGPLEDMPGWLAFAGRPEHLVIGLGATRYTAEGQGDRLRVGDVSVVVVYDGTQMNSVAVQAAVAAGADIPGASVLRQRVVHEESA